MRENLREMRLFFHKIPTLVTDLSVGEAAVARDALCRTLYSRLFTWIVARINDAVKVSTQMSSQPIFCNRNPTYVVEVFLKSPAKLYIPSNTLAVKMFCYGWPVYEVKYLCSRGRK